MTVTTNQANSIKQNPISIVALCGSLRRESFNMQLLKCAAEVSPPGVQVDIYADMQSIPPFSEDLETDSDYTAPVEALRDKVRRADGMLIATPEYNRSLPGVLKNTLDWLSRPAPDEVLSGKPVLMVGATSGPWGTRFAQCVLRQVLVATESYVVNGPELFVRDAENTMGQPGEPMDASTVERLRTMMQGWPAWLARYS